MDRLKLMCVLAHPDDESLGTGGTLAKYAAEGVETYLVTATRGECGWFGDEQHYPGPEALGKMREAELMAAARVFGVREVRFLDYIDGDLDQADPAEAVAKIVGHVRRVRPQVVVTFGPDGSYGHPDHIAISQFATAAVVCAADGAYADAGRQAPHRVSKLYYMADTKDALALYRSVFGDLMMRVDGVERRALGWENWAITTWLDADPYWRTARQAIACHQSQLAGYGKKWAPLLEEHHKTLLSTQTYYRALSTVNGGRKVERDLFDGLRSAAAGPECVEGLDANDWVTSA